MLAADPKNIKALRASGRVEIEAGNPQAALEPLNKALSLATLSGNQEEKGSILQAIGHCLPRPEPTGRSPGQLSAGAGNQEENWRSKWHRSEPGADGHACRTRLGQSDAALASYKAALEVDRKIGDKEGLLSNLINLGKFYHDHGKYDEALKTCE